MTISKNGTEVEFTETEDGKMTFWLHGRALVKVNEYGSISISHDMTLTDAVQVIFEMAHMIQDLKMGEKLRRYE